MKNIKVYFFAALILSAVACDDETTSSDVPAEMDKQFMLAAFDDGLFEVNAGQVASSKGTTSVITDFGGQLLDDHTVINQELMQLAKEVNLDLPTTLSNAKQQKLDTLSGLSGMAFDTTYIKMMVSTHEGSINLYEIQATTGRNVTLKTFASDNLTKLRAHLETAKSMKDSIQ
ncbi:DUF4142 domain-containing protein [Dyadobacter fanqingshengii]|uniref:DUF4142 domain-containing protein n=1 Tax=Dyadobacter fanqingshengii TaxID=2906443 RepID=A0A9X1PF73_9BACT|nr:DUF4142 domain-containing protein [Dyadobacter fanqingshengii]MCF0042690.1 DUF4142 domain-containing protein [Dyadobacter fanqingshengii]MCF2504539.1 DUF4142 domain-containing protein [Dyadobacter fanqingshengii]USJ36086.1 DUF4142 domain-containing protein [Dyadobacter fanqingshengii]